MNPCHPSHTKYIPIFRGDDTDFQGNSKILVRLFTDESLEGYKALFVFLGKVKEFSPIPESRELEVAFSAEETKDFKLGFWDAELLLVDPDGKRKTLCNRIGIHVTNSPAEAYGINGENNVPVAVIRPIFYEEIRHKPTLNGVVIEGDKTTEDYHIEGGGGEGTTNYERLFNKPKINGVELNGNKSSSGLGLQGELPRDGSIYDIVVTSAASAESAEVANHAETATNDGEGNDIVGTYAKKSDTYDKSEVDDKITRFVAHYLTDKVNGRFVPFATHAALAAAKAAHTEQNPRFFYAGQGFTPTKNDYCVVLADETYEGKTTRYSYVGDWPTGSFQYQYTINDTAFSQAQWDAINSGITSELIEQFGEALEGKQDALAVGEDGVYQIKANAAIDADNAAKAESADKDGDGNDIAQTYAKKFDDTTVAYIDEERHDDSISAKIVRIPISFAKKPFNAVRVRFHQFPGGTDLYMAVGYSTGTGGTGGVTYTDTPILVSTNIHGDFETGELVYRFGEDCTKDIPDDAKFLTFFFATNQNVSALDLRTAPIETGYATDAEVAQKKYQIQETDGFFHLEHAPLFDFLIVNDEVARKSNVESVSDKVAEIGATVSVNNRFLVNGTTAAIQTRENEESEFTDEIRLDKGYDAVQGTEMVKLDKSVQTVTVDGGTLAVVFPDAVDGTVRDLCLYVNNTNSTTECEMTFQDGTYYGADGWDSAAQKGGITGYYFSEIPGNGWRVSREELTQFTKGA